MNTRQYYADITPFSGLAPRDARPFDAEESGAARGPELFPPAPAPFWYALRDALHPVDKATRRLRDGRIFGSRPKDERSAKLRLRLQGLWLRRDEEDYFPVPHDVLTDHDTKAWSLLRPRVESELAGSNAEGLGRPWLSEFTKASEAAGGFLTRAQLMLYLSGKLEAHGWFTNQNELVAHQGRIGLELSSRRAKTGRLYSRQVTYFKEGAKDEMCFRARVEIESADPPPNGAAVRLGGESKMAHVGFSPIDNSHDFDPGRVKDAIISNYDSAEGILRVKLCLLTPAIFSANAGLLLGHFAKGFTPAWRPFRTNAWELPQAGNVARARLAGAIVPRAIALGAWDHSRDPDRAAGPGLAKPLYRCVPAGAVYFLEIKPAEGVRPEAVVEGLFKLYWFNSMLLREVGKLTHFGELGFGVTAVGAWQPASSGA